MAKFDLGAFAQTLRTVPETGTEGSERIEYIPLDQLHEDRRNFYAVSGVDELAANIQLCGLMDPLRVSKAEDGYTIVSGHRRFAALSLLAKDDPRFAQAACIVDPGTESPQMQELRLIYANADTRRMSSADIARQAERVQELLYELKEQGVDFPGRMRDHVAEACKISKSKLSRLEAIRSHLAPDIRKAYWDGPEKGRLNEAAAYSLSRLPEDYQRQVVDAYRRGDCGDAGLKWLTAGVVDKIRDDIEAAEDLLCKAHGKKCLNFLGKVHHIIQSRIKFPYSYSLCAKACCRTCASCKDVCPRLKDAQRQARADSRVQAQQEKAARAAKEAPDIEQIRAIWQRFAALRKQAGLTPDEYKGKIDCPWMMPERDMLEQESGTAKITLKTFLPYGGYVHLSDIKRWVAAADALGCSVDYLMMRTDDPQPISPVPGQQLILAGWMPGGTNPGHDCECLVIVDVGSEDHPGQTMRTSAYWCGGAFWLSRRGADKINLPVLAWLEVPAWERADKEDATT
jgi:ParB family chromosome partitioning protein